MASKFIKVNTLGNDGRFTVEEYIAPSAIIKFIINPNISATLTLADGTTVIIQINDLKSLVCYPTDYLIKRKCRIA